MLYIYYDKNDILKILFVFFDDMKYQAEFLNGNTSLSEEIFIYHYSPLLGSYDNIKHIKIISRYKSCHQTVSEGTLLSSNEIWKMDPHLSKVVPKLTTSYSTSNEELVKCPDFVFHFKHLHSNIHILDSISFYFFFTIPVIICIVCHMINIYMLTSEM